MKKLFSLLLAVLLLFCFVSCDETESTTTENGTNDPAESVPVTTTEESEYVKNPRNAIQMNKEYVSRTYNSYDAITLAANGISFHEEGGTLYCLMLDAMFEMNATPSTPRPVLTIEGAEYYRIGAGQSPAYLNFTEDNIEILDVSTNAVIAKLALLQNGNLIVLESSCDNFNKDEELSIAWNYLGN